MQDQGAAGTHRVLVTGATGFLGAHLLPELRTAGWDVFAHGRTASVLAERAPAERVIAGSLAELSQVDLPVDAVVHAAALSSPWGRWSEFLEANVAGTQQAIDFAARVGARRFVHISSPSVYAAARDRVAITEDDVDETNRLNGYIRSKIMAERLIRDAVRTGLLAEAVILRPRGLIGVGDPSLVPRLLHVHERIGVPLLNGGQHPIDVTAVENVAYAARLALTAGDAHAGVYNITNGEPRPFRELLDRLIDLLGRPRRYRSMNRRAAYALAAALEATCAALPGRPEPPLTRYTITAIAYAQTLDISRARAELGYQPRVRLDDALRTVAADLKAVR